MKYQPYQVIISYRGPPNWKRKATWRLTLTHWAKITLGQILRIFVGPTHIRTVWSEGEKLAMIEKGHYQVSWPWGNKVGTAFNMHPAPHGLNWRTNLYYMETEDLGKTWRNVQGEEIELPLTTVDNPALIHDFRSEKRNVYMKDLAYDASGRPVILFLTSGGWESGPVNNPRTWQTARWTGSEWELRSITNSDNHIVYF